MAASKPPGSAPPAYARPAATLPPESPRAISRHAHPERQRSSRPPPPSGKSTKPGLAIDFALMTPAARMVQELLVVGLGEKVAILHDAEGAGLALAFEHAANEAHARAERIDMEELARRPWTTCPTAALEAVRGAAVTILVVRPEDGEYECRTAIIQTAKLARTRHVHMVGVSPRTFAASMAAPVSRVVGLLEALRAAMQPTSKLVARSPAGTRLEVEMAPHLRWVASGGVVSPGQWINVPYGQLITSPGSVRGVYVADASMSGSLGNRVGSLAQKPIKLTFENNRVKTVECPDTAVRMHVERFVAEGDNHDRVGCLNLGANVGIVAPAGEPMHDEHMPGLHLTLGENYRDRTGATWTARGQLALTMAESDVDLDGVPLIRRGRYVRFV